MKISSQGIIDYTGIKTFAKEPKLAKLLRGFSRMSVSLNLLRFGAG